MGELKARLRADLTAATKARDEVTKATLRLALTAISRAEVAGEQARELDDGEVLELLTRESRKRDEAAEAYESAGRVEQAQRERAEQAVLVRYLPRELSGDELAALARSAVDEVAASLGEPPGPRQMGQVMKAAQSAADGRVDGARLAAAVRALLTG